MPPSSRGCALPAKTICTGRSPVEDAAIARPGRGRAGATACRSASRRAKPIVSASGIEHLVGRARTSTRPPSGRVGPCASVGATSTSAARISCVRPTARRPGSRRHRPHDPGLARAPLPAPPRYRSSSVRSGGGHPGRHVDAVRDVRDRDVSGGTSRRSLGCHIARATSPCRSLTPFDTGRADGELASGRTARPSSPGCTRPSRGSSPATPSVSGTRRDDRERLLAAVRLVPRRHRRVRREHARSRTVAAPPRIDVPLGRVRDASSSAASAGWPSFRWKTRGRDARSRRAPGRRRCRGRRTARCGSPSPS